MRLEAKCASDPYPYPYGAGRLGQTAFYELAPTGRGRLRKWV